MRVLKLWTTWSEGLSEIHFWNQATVRPFINKEKETLAFDQIAYAASELGETKVVLIPPFLVKYGAGMVRIQDGTKSVEPFQLDLWQKVEPGTPASTSAIQLSEAMKLVHDLHNKILIGDASIWMIHYLSERLLLHEIEANFFVKDSPEVLTKAMARLHLMVVAKGTKKEEFSTYFPRLFVFPLPDEITEAKGFLNELEEVDPLSPDVPERFRVAAAMILFKGLITVAQNEKKEQMPFPLFKEEGISTPVGGFDHGSFLAAVRKVYPSFDQVMEGAKSTMIESMRKNFIRKDSKKEDSEASKEMLLSFPDNYTTEVVDELTLTFPEEIREAALIAGKEFSEKITHADKILRGRFAKDLKQPVAFSEEDVEALKSYGISFEEEILKFWSLQTAAMTNGASFVLNLAKSREVEIWMRSDLLRLLGEGYTHPNYEREGEDDLNYNFGMTLPNFKVHGVSIEDLMEAYNEKPSPPLPVGVKDANIASKSLEDQLKAIRKGDLLIEKFSEAADTLSPEDFTGSETKILTERQMFFLVIHEVIEGGLIAKTIASQDRRWFCDGLANLIAIRESDRRFGKGAGMGIFNELFSEKESEKFAEFVDLAGWKALERQDENAAEVEGVQAAYYFYATKALLEACEGKDQKFIHDWIQKVQQTKWIRTNSDTVVYAYKKMTGDDLYSILKKVVPSQTDPAP